MAGLWLARQWEATSPNPGRGGTVRRYHLTLNVPNLGQHCSSYWCNHWALSSESTAQLTKDIELKNLWSNLLCCLPPWSMYRMQQAQRTSEEHTLGGIQVHSWDTQNIVRCDHDLHVLEEVQEEIDREVTLRANQNPS